MGFFNAIQRQRHVVKDCRAVLSKVGKMWEGRAGVVVSAKTLQSTPYSRKSRKKAKETRVPGVALRGVVPVIRIEAKEKFNILDVCQMAIITIGVRFN